MRRPFTHPAWLCVALAATMASVSVGDAQSQASELDRTDRVVVASTIYSLIQQYFAHWEGSPRADVDAAYREYIAQVLRDTSRKDFALATFRFIASLRNGHSQFFDSALDARPLKFRLLEVENKWVVISSQDSHLPRGSVVRDLNEIPIGDFVREMSHYVAASNDRIAQSQLFSYPALFPEKNSLRLENGDVVIVDRSTPADVPPSTAPVQAAQGRWLRDGRVAYIRIPTFGDPAYERTAIEFVRQYAASPNLIVDVRGNGGGATPFQLVAALLNRPRRWWQESTPQRTALFEAQGNPTLRVSRDFAPQPAAADAYKARLFILVDRFCGSACEDFVMPFKDTQRAVVVGETTQGSSGNPFRANLGFGLAISVGAVRYRFPDGSPFEGVGIAPDVVVGRRVADVIAGRDAVLDRAQALANAGQ